jgi:hypothetical protein
MARDRKAGGEILPARDSGARRRGRWAIARGVARPVPAAGDARRRTGLQRARMRRSTPSSPISARSLMLSRTSWISGCRSWKPGIVRRSMRRLRAGPMPILSCRVTRVREAADRRVKRLSASGPRHGRSARPPASASRPRLDLLKRRMPRLSSRPLIARLTAAGSIKRPRAAAMKLARSATRTKTGLSVAVQAGPTKHAPAPRPALLRCVAPPGSALQLCNLGSGQFFESGPDHGFGAA